MNNRTSFEELLDLWLVQKIGYEEMASVSEKSLDEVKEEAALHKLAVTALEKYAVKETASKIHGRYLASRKAKNQVSAPIVPLSRNKWIIRAAASAALLMGLYIASENVFLNSEKIYSSNFQDYFMNVERGFGMPENLQMDEYFREGDYASTINAYKQLPEKTNRQTFLAGYAYLKTGEFNHAKEAFNKILNSGEGKGEFLFKDEAEYYLAMTYLKLGEVEKAYQLFSKINEDRTHTFNDNIDNWTLTRMRWFK